MYRSGGSVVFLVCVATSATVMVTLASKLSADNEILNNYSVFFNFGDKKLNKLSAKSKLENSIVNSKMDVLGGVFKKNIDVVKATGKMDLIFLIDASSSVGQANFKSEIKFVKKMLSDVTVDYDHTRVAVVTFSSSTIINVDEISEPQKENNKCLLLNKQLGDIRYTGGGTYTIGALKTAQEIFKDSRNDSQKILFLITDGYSNGGDPVHVANDMKKQQITIFTIGIQNGNYKELFEVSSSPGEFHSYLLDSFQEFESLARRALHVDLQSGEYVPLGSEHPCDGLCNNDVVNGSCCDSHALCTCGTSTGHYQCLCQPGYYGSGLINSCTPCPEGTYSGGPNLCLPCPDLHHTTEQPATSIESCQCKAGYRPTEDGRRCEVITCPKLSPPEHGYFVKRKECGTVLHNACGVRCEVGYTLTGSSIRLCQPNATWSGHKPSCQVKTCTRLSSPAHGAMRCTHADLDQDFTEEKEDERLPVDTVCYFGCGKGRMLVGSPQRTCLPLAQWDGLKVSCKQFKCNKLPKIAHGTVEPESCTKDKRQEYGTNCTIKCDEGFKLRGPTVKSCKGAHGSWLPKQTPVCHDITPPVIECPKSLVNTTLPGSHVGTVFWKPPKVSDNSGLNVTVWLKPAIKNLTNFKFKIGKTVITYFAMDAFKNKVSCNFTVEIIDSEPPTIEDCIDPPTFLSPDKNGTNVTWDEPNIFDNSLQPVTITKSQEYGFLPIGTTTIEYTATDVFNNTGRCLLNITLQEARCEALPDPVFGHSDCSPLTEGLQCVVTCQDGYAIPVGPPIAVDNSSSRFLCEHSDPIWYSQENSVFPDCTVTQIPTEVHQEGVITLVQEVDADGGDNGTDICNDTNSLNEIQNEIMTNMQNGLGESCTENELSCVVDTAASCENENESQYEEKTNKITKRELPKNATSKKLMRRRKRINVRFKMNVKKRHQKGVGNGNNTINSLSADEARKFETFQGKMRNIQFATAANATVFNGKNFKVDIKFEEVKILCSVGFISKKHNCVQCPAGTFQNASRNACQSCPIGFYNEKVSQIGCTPCPLNFSTRRIHSKSLKACKAHCAPGTYARRKTLRAQKRHPNSVVEQISLMPFCRICEVGTYQPKYGQTACISCPAGTTTLRRGADHISQCVPTAASVCANDTAICNHNGQCVMDGDFYYSCNCDSNYIGSHCETRINSCLSNPCLNSGECELDGISASNGNRLSASTSSPSPPHHHHQDDGYVCRCAPGYAGPNCEESTSTAVSEVPADRTCNRGTICQNGGTCVRSDREDIGGGGTSPAANAAAAAATLAGTASEEEDEELCICRKGYGGDRCETKIEYCSEGLCENDGLCEETDTGYLCHCVGGYIGRRCNILPCDYKPCPPENAICINKAAVNATRTSYRCECVEGWRGRNCTEAIDFCEHEPCKNGARCVSHSTRYTCECPRFHYGYNCEFRMMYDYMLSFPRSGITDFVRMDGFKVNVSELTVCMWMQTLDNFNYGTLMSYSTKQFDNTFTLTDYTGLVFYVNGQHVITDVYLNDGYWHFFCASWTSKEGGYNVYVDGKLVQNGTGLSNGTNVAGNGVMVIGQEQDILGGKFSQSEAFLGNITQFDVWDRVLDIDTVKRLMESCDEYHGDIYSWPEVQSHVKGDVRILQSTFCQQCDPPNPIENGLIEIIENVAQYKCKKGHEIYFQKQKYDIFNRTCTKSSAWEGTEEPYCKSIYCGHPGYLINGIIKGLSYFYNDELTFQCYDGYNMTGSTSSKCLADGKWSNPKPSCTGIQCVAFERPANAQLTVLSDQPPEDYLTNVTKFDLGTQIEVTCTEEAKLIGENVLSCQDDGNWDFDAPVCELATTPAPVCSVAHIPPPPRNGYILEETVTAVSNGSGVSVTYRCRNGYKLNGENSTECLDGRWTEPNVSCTPIECNSPPKPSNMEVEHVALTKQQRYYFGNMMRYICTEGHVLYGSNFIRCQASGRWSRMSGRCARISCRKPDVAEGTIIEGNSYLYLDHVTLICPHSSRSVNLTCTSLGVWEGIWPKDCLPLHLQ